MPLDLPSLQLGLFICLILADLLDLEQIRTSFVPAELSFTSYQIFTVFPPAAVRASQLIFPSACLDSSLPLGSSCMQRTDSHFLRSEVGEVADREKGTFFCVWSKEAVSFRHWLLYCKSRIPAATLCAVGHGDLPQKSDYPAKSTAFLIKQHSEEHFCSIALTCGCGRPFVVHVHAHACVRTHPQLFGVFAFIWHPV